MDDIIAELPDTTITSCHFKCKKVKKCKGWAIPKPVDVGVLTTCFFLKDGLWKDTSPAYNHGIREMWVVGLVSNAFFVIKSIFTDFCVPINARR